MNLSKLYVDAMLNQSLLEFFFLTRDVILSLLKDHGRSYPFESASCPRPQIDVKSSKSCARVFAVLKECGRCVKRQRDGKGKESMAIMCVLVSGNELTKFTVFFPVRGTPDENTFRTRNGCD